MCILIITPPYTKYVNHTQWQSDCLWLERDGKRVCVLVVSTMYVIRASLSLCSLDRVRGGCLARDLYSRGLPMVTRGRTDRLACLKSEWEKIPSTRTIDVLYYSRVLSLRNLSSSSEVLWIIIFTKTTHLFICFFHAWPSYITACVCLVHTADCFFSSVLWHLKTNVSTAIQLYC